MDNNILYQLYLNLQNLISENDSDINLNKVNNYYSDKFKKHNIFTIKYTVTDIDESIIINKNELPYLKTVKIKKQSYVTIYFERISYILYSEYSASSSTEQNIYMITVEDVEYLLFILLKKEYDVFGVISDLFENNLKCKKNEIVTSIDGLKYKARDLKLETIVKNNV